jgi:cupin domain
MEWALPDRSALYPPPHFHPDGQRERFEALEGRIELLVGRKWRCLEAGQELEIPPGVRHTLRNRSGESARIRDTHAPGRRFEPYIRGIVALANETGSTRPTRPVAPRAAIRAAMLSRQHADTFAAAGFPLRLGIAIGVLIGRAFGLRP